MSASKPLQKTQEKKGKMNDPKKAAEALKKIEEVTRLITIMRPASVESSTRRTTEFAITISRLSVRKMRSKDSRNRLTIYGGNCSRRSPGGRRQVIEWPLEQFRFSSAPIPLTTVSFSARPYPQKMFFNV